MAAKNLITVESDNSLSFGDYTLPQKSKVEDFPYDGNLMKVKTFNEITKLERNENFVYESVPGSAVFNFKASEAEVTFSVTGAEDIQITLELEPDKEYDVEVAGATRGRIRTNLGGKLVFSVEAQNEKETPVKVVRV
jgi:hypothetical protein